MKRFPSLLVPAALSFGCLGVAFADDMEKKDKKAAVASEAVTEAGKDQMVSQEKKADTELAVGAAAPSFTLLGTDGKKHSLDSYVEGATATVVVFTCNTCPFSKAYEPVLLELATKYAKEKVAFVLINSNSPEVRPGDSYEKMVDLAKEKAYPFPYVFDATQEVAHAYGARVTPHVFVVDSEQVCRYRGRIDDSAKREDVKQHDLIAAVDALLAGTDVPVAATEAFGCSIKWKKTS